MRAWLALLAATSAFAVPSNASAASNVTILPNSVVPPSGLAGDCPARIIAQKSNPLCKQQCGPNFTPQYDNSCLCKSPSKANGAACSPVCTNGFTLSQDLTQCICATRKFTSLDGKTCSNNCPAGQFGGANGQCTPCSANVKTCRDANTALTCNSGFFLNKGACVTKCPLSTYVDSTNTCRACADSDASSCKDGGANSATACMTKYLVNGQCIAADSLPGGMYADTTTHTAKHGKDSNGNQLFLNFDGTCVAQCAAGSYNDPHTDACLKCDSTALTCDVNGALTCGKDSVGTQLYLTPTKKCILAAAGVPAYYPDAVTNVCTACDANETSCKGNGPGQALSCASGTYLSQSGDCLSAGACKASGAFWPDASNNVCSTCDAGEAACTGNGAGLATACASNADGKQLYLYKGDCYTSNACPAATYPDNNSKTCTACDAGALTCTGPHAALTCGADSNGARLFLNINGDCVTAPNCDSSTYADYATRKCESCSLIDPDAKTCTTPSLITCSSKFFFQSSCVDPCPTRMYGNTANHVCTPCADPDALTCDASGALSCNNGYLWQKMCQTACPSGTYANGHVCSSCTDKYGAGVATCDASKLLTCSNGYVLAPDGNSCISQAQCANLGGYYASQNGQCTACSATWPNSNACTVAGPSSCANGFVLENGQCLIVCPDGYGKPPNYFMQGSCRSPGGTACQSWAVSCDQQTCRTTLCFNQVLTNFNGATCHNFQ
ncbi:hypothetical protein JCM10049v2_001440 [Rhodotorula toruloides]